MPPFRLELVQPFTAEEGRERGSREAVKRVGRAVAAKRNSSDRFCSSSPAFSRERCVRTVTDCLEAAREGVGERKNRLDIGADPPVWAAAATLRVTGCLPQSLGRPASRGFSDGGSITMGFTAQNTPGLLPGLVSLWFC